MYEYGGIKTGRFSGGVENRSATPREFKVLQETQLMIGSHPSDGMPISIRVPKSRLGKSSKVVKFDYKKAEIVAASETFN